MANVKFYLKKTDKKGEAAIMLTYLHKGKKFRYYTRLKTKPNTWKDQRVKSNFIGFQEINGLLDDLENSLKTIEREALFNKKDYSIELIKKKFLQKLGELRNENNFFTVYDRFIEESRPIKAKNTIKAYAETKRKIQQFASAKSFKITFENIDQNFYEAFLNYLIKDLGHLNNTVGKHIKTLKTFLNYSIDHEYTNMNYNLKKIKVLSEEVDIIYLTEEELMKIYEQKGLSKKLSNVRDNFCFACFTGLRFSDISKIKYS